MQNLPCRLCAASTTPWAKVRVLNRYDVHYIRCTACGSLQTEPPYWLAEAYQPQGTGRDTGAVHRSLDASVRTAALLTLISWPSDRVALDYGAGMGLFGRLMRDRGFNFFAYDRYLSPFFMDQFSTDDPATLQPALITAHEVLEHLADPASELPAIFGRGANLVIVTTDLFEDQKADWPYLAPEHGQHVFFYSSRAMRSIGERFGYRYAALPILHVYWQPEFEQQSNIREAVAFADDSQKFGQFAVQQFLNHLAAPGQHAMRDAEAIAVKLR